MNENVTEISRLAGLMHDQLGGFLKRFNKIENELNDALQSYKDANTTLTGQRGVVQYAKKVQDLGAKTSKNIYCEPGEIDNCIESINGSSTNELEDFPLDKPSYSDEIPF